MGIRNQGRLPQRPGGTRSPVPLPSHSARRPGGGRGGTQVHWGHGEGRVRGPGVEGAAGDSGVEGGDLWKRRGPRGPGVEGGHAGAEKSGGDTEPRGRGAPERAAQQAGRPLGPAGLAAAPSAPPSAAPRAARVPRCSRPRPPAAIMRQSARDRGPGLHRRQPRGRRISISRPSCLFFCAHFPVRMLSTSRHILSSGATGQNAAARVLGRRRPRSPVAFGGPLPPALPDQTSLGTARQGKGLGRGTPAGTGLPRTC